MSDPYDIAVIGGGASGLAAAITAAREGASVCVIERDVEVGLPILATGNGRCNVSNACLDPTRYWHPDVARAVMGEQPEMEIRALFESLGLLMTEEDDGRLYPVTHRAESVRDVLLNATVRTGVSLRCGTEVTGAAFDSAWELTICEPASPLSYKQGHDAKATLRNARKALAAAPRRTSTVRARHVILACGGESERACALFGLPHLAEEPVLCPISAQINGVPDALAALDGLRVDAELALRREGQIAWRETGEVLFRSYGISGIAAFNLSRRIEPGDTALIDLFPQLDREAFHTLLTQRSEMLGPFSPDSPAWFDGLLAPALARTVCRLYTLCHPGETDVSHIVSICKHLKLVISGTAEPQQAQVHRGGVPFDAVNLETLAVHSALSADIFVCGEALDMDADCGGYNLAWAWLSGIHTGKEAAHA